MGIIDKVRVHISFYLLYFFLIIYYLYLSIGKDFWLRLVETQSKTYLNLVPQYKTDYNNVSATEGDS